MKVFGIIGTAFGAFLTVIGILANNSKRMVAEHFFEYGPGSSPGGIYITVGLLMLAVGVLLLSLRYLKGKKPQGTEGQ